MTPNESNKNNNDRELFNEKIRGIYAAIQANADINNQSYKVILEKLNTIQNQTIKNDRATLENSKAIEELKLNSVQHILQCPISPKISKIEEDLLEYKLVKKYPKIFMIGIAMMGIIIAYEILSKFVI